MSRETDAIIAVMAASGIEHTVTDINTPKAHAATGNHYKTEPSVAPARWRGQWWHLTNDQQGTLNAAIAAGFGIATALSVAKEKAAALVAGFAQSLIALALAFGADLSPDLQSTIMTFVITGVAWYLRTQVTAPVADDGSVVETTVASTRTSPGHYA